MRHIIAFLCCMAIAVSAVLFGVIQPDSLLRSYSSVVEVLGKSQLTSNYSLIGERYEEKDDYTGGYKSSTENKTGQDVAYGGCSLKVLNIRIFGKIDNVDGTVKIYIRNGKSISEIFVDEKGYFDEQLVFDGGDNYILVQYENFTGNIDFKTEYF